MDAYQCILTRRSIRNYRDVTVEKRLIDQLLRAGMHAPSARNTRPWHFVVIQDHAALARLAEIHPSGKMLKEAALAIAVCADEQRQPMEGYQALDCAATTQNILLAAHALGLGAVWLGIYPREERIEMLAAFLSLPAHIHPVSLISVGIPSVITPEVDRYDPSRVHYETW
ncbi:MAG: nitroreductase family protein [Anaerolineae bacterium]|nr:nitroreductase family protein [Anaerolineae bacterium]